MHGIVFDLETQRLFSDVKRVIEQVDRIPGPQWASITSRGFPAPPRWLGLDAQAALHSPTALLDALEAANVSEIFYDPALHEIDAIAPIADDWRTMLTRRLRLAAGVTWDAHHSFRVWSEADVPALVDELTRFPYIIGVNAVSFDYPVLERYHPAARERLAYKTIDILAYAEWGLFLTWLNDELAARGLPSTEEALKLAWRHIKGTRRFEIWEATFDRRDSLRLPGHRITLDALARATLGTGKSQKSSGAPALFQQGRLADLVAYCQHDVELTRDLFIHGCQHRAIRFKSRELPVRWAEVAAALERLSEAPSLLLPTEDFARQFQGEILAASDASPLEQTLSQMRLEKLREQDRNYRRERREELTRKREKLARNLRWLARQQELETIRRLRKQGRLSSGSELAHELGVKSSTVAQWARKLRLKVHLAGLYYYTLSQAKLLRRYGMAAPKERAQIVRAVLKKARKKSAA